METGYAVVSSEDREVVLRDFFDKEDGIYDLILYGGASSCAEEGGSVSSAMSGTAGSCASRMAEGERGGGF